MNIMTGLSVDTVYRFLSSGDSRMKKVGGHCGAKEQLGGET